jgi:hypothetical protein
MGPAKKAAVSNHEKSQVVADDRPSSTKPCPYMKPLRIGVFFDGTGNNKYVDKTDGHETNVVRLFEVYNDKSGKDKDGVEVVRDKLYLIGVGAGEAPKATDGAVAGHNEKGTFYGQNWVRGHTAGDKWSGNQSDVGTGTRGGAFGAGIEDRLNKAYNWVKAKVQSHSDQYLSDSLKLIDIYGFSRGAMSARTFNNLVNQALSREAPKDAFRNVQVRFLGVYDTVDSSWGTEVNMGLSSNDFLGARHFTARDEIRENFPLTLLDTNDIEYAGVHSDVGGGYANLGTRDPLDEGKSNWLAGPPLWDMYEASKLQGVEFTGDPTLPGGMSLADVEKIRTESNLFDGTGADKTTTAAKTWQATYVHKSDGTGIGMDARRVPPEKGARYFRGQCLNPVAKREVVRVQKFTLKTMPPSFSWNS